MIVANRINGVRVVSIAARPVYWIFTGVGWLALAVLTWRTCYRAASTQTHETGR
jgi:hypothetical protein